MVWSKNGHFSNFFFIGKIRKENVFYYILERKNSFLGYKKKEVQKVEKLPFFPKGLTKGFGPKIAVFQLLFFRQYRSAICLLGYSRKKKILSSL